MIAESCKKEVIGEKRKCKLCASAFITGRRRNGETRVHCPHCAWLLDSKNFHLLTKEERHLRYTYYRPYLLKYGKKPEVLSSHLVYTKQWRKRNPERRYIQKKRGTDRYNEETMELAENHKQRWSSDEDAYLKEKSQTETAREIAANLGRTYTAIIARASGRGIPLMTEDKKHGRLVTR